MKPAGYVGLVLSRRASAGPIASAVAAALAVPSAGEVEAPKAFIW